MKKKKSNVSKVNEKKKKKNLNEREKKFHR